MQRIIQDYPRMIIMYYVPSQTGFLYWRVQYEYHLHTLYATLVCRARALYVALYARKPGTVPVPGTLVAGTEGVESGPAFERVLTCHGAQRASRGTSTHYLGSGEHPPQVATIEGRRYN